MIDDVSPDDMKVLEQQISHFWSLIYYCSITVALCVDDQSNRSANFWWSYVPRMERNLVCILYI